MLGEGQEALGTIQDAVNDTEPQLDGILFLYLIFLSLTQYFNAELQTYLRVQPGPASVKPQRLSDNVRAALFAQYNSTQLFSVHYPLDPNPCPGSSQLQEFALFHDFALLDGRRITPLSKSTRESAGSSIVKVSFGEDFWYGEVVNIFSHAQHGFVNGTQLLAEFRWMKELPLSPVDDDPWSAYPELDVKCFALDAFCTPAEANSPPCVLPFDCIVCQISRGVVTTTDPCMWITTTMDRHPSK
ncbi:hypothetical protein EDB19DRAFT_1641004 [Suillus lakei]|nr:hypothetical protein EDB19DRAFT_1641004 [Suillus lakei]